MKKSKAEYVDIRNMYGCRIKQVYSNRFVYATFKSNKFSSNGNPIYNTYIIKQETLSELLKTGRRKLRVVMKRSREHLELDQW